MNSPMVGIVTAAAVSVAAAGTGLAAAESRAVSGSTPTASRDHFVLIVDNGSDRSLPDREWEEKSQVIGVLLDLYRLQAGEEGEKEVVAGVLGRKGPPRAGWQNMQRTILWEWAKNFLGDDYVSDYVSARLLLSRCLREKWGKAEWTRLSIAAEQFLKEAVRIKPPFSIRAAFKLAAQNYLVLLK